MDLEILKTDEKNKDFIKLINLLDADLNERYGELQKQYEVHNKVDYIKEVVIIYKDRAPIGCGAFKEYDTDTVEMKRIFIVKENRGQGLSKLIIKELEKEAVKGGYKYAVLETGIKQIEAINLYKKSGYSVIQNYGQYIGNVNSLCMKKALL